MPVHTHTMKNAGSHSHGDTNYDNGSGNSIWGGSGLQTSPSGDHTNNNDEEHNNMQPGNKNNRPIINIKIIEEGLSYCKT